MFFFLCYVYCYWEYIIAYTKCQYSYAPDTKINITYSQLLFYVKCRTIINRKAAQYSYIKITLLPRLEFWIEKCFCIYENKILLEILVVCGTGCLIFPLILQKISKCFLWNFRSHTGHVFIHCIPLKKQLK